MKKSTILPLLFAHCALGSVSASNIAFISFHGDDNTPTADAATAGFTQAPDIGYTNLLSANGHTVTRIVGSGTPNAAVLNAFDLVVVGRSNNSGNFQNANATNWNNISAPMIIMSGYLTRNSRLGLTTGGTVPDTFNQADAIVDTISLTALVPGHPVFTGIALDGSNTTSPFATEVTFSGGATPVVQRGISVNTDPLAGGGTLLAKIANAGDPANTGTGMIIAEWAAGSVLANTPNSTLAGHRMVFFSGSREMGITSQAAGIYDLTADGSRMFLNAVDFMAVPEPSSTMTLGLLGAAALLRRRRK